MNDTEKRLMYSLFSDIDKMIKKVDVIVTIWIISALVISIVSAIYAGGPVELVAVAGIQ